VFSYKGIESVFDYVFLLLTILYTGLPLSSFEILHHFEPKLLKPSTIIKSSSVEKGSLLISGFSLFTNLSLTYLLVLFGIHLAI
jgi:hypothetical protein